MSNSGETGADMTVVDPFLKLQNVFEYLLYQRTSGPDTYAAEVILCAQREVRECQMAMTIYL